MELVIHSKHLEPITVVRLPIDNYRTLIKTKALKCTINNDPNNYFNLYALDVMAPDGEMGNIFWSPDEEKVLSIVPTILAGQRGAMALL